MKNFYIILILVIYSVPVKAWDVYDWDKGVYIDINCKGVGEGGAILHPTFNPNPTHPFQTSGSSNMVPV